MADRTSLYTKTQLREQHRMKPGRDQLPASRYWQGHGYVDLYDLAQAVPLRPARAASPAQTAALAAGRSLAGTMQCVCGRRGDRAFVLKHGICGACYDNAMWEQQQDEERDRRLSVREAAADALARGALVLDVETTGLDEEAEIIEIAVVDLAGAVLFDSLVKPVGQVTPEAHAIHGIDDAMLANAPGWPAVYSSVAPLLAGRHLAAHNVAFERRLLEQTCLRYGLAPVASAGWICTMEMATPLNDGRWPNLARALRLAGVYVDMPLPAHRSRGDAERCRLLLQGLCSLQD
jgi:DNA polymerase-3 subunit epsilon